MDRSKLPKVSIITPTYNRIKCMKLALINYKLIDYPREKLEWIIIDDGDYDIADRIPRDDATIKYYHLNPYCKAQLHKDLKSSLKKKANQASTNKKAKKFKLHNIHHNSFIKDVFQLE
jgi:cellulose synthase/poly-beta-1,6-N-acetylglucosamine synthase-like glycosyltransferase